MLGPSQFFLLVKYLSKNSITCSYILLKKLFITSLLKSIFMQFQKHKNIPNKAKITKNNEKIIENISTSFAYIISNINVIVDSNDNIIDSIKPPKLVR